MITKQFRITVALLAIGAVVALSASAGQFARKANPKPLKIQLPPVSLAASAHKYLASAPSWTNWSGVWKVKVIVSNNSGAVIRQGTTIFWSIANQGFPQEKKGSFTLDQEFNPNTRVSQEVPGVPVSYLPSSAVKAWYVPKATPPVN